MNISKMKLAWKYLTGGATGVIDYVLDIANNAVYSLSDANKDKIASVLVAVKRIITTARTISWLVPTKWIGAYEETLAALAKVADACEDLAITPEELSATIAAWQSAYAAWRAE